MTDCEEFEAKSQAGAEARDVTESARSRAVVLADVAADDFRECPGDTSWLYGGTLDERRALLAELRGRGWEAEADIEGAVWARESKP